MHAQKTKRRGKPRTHYPQDVMLSLKIKNLVFLLFQEETHIFYLISESLVSMDTNFLFTLWSEINFQGGLLQIPLKN